MDVKQKLGQYSESKKKIILILCLVTGLSMMLISGFVSSSSKKQKNKDINLCTSWVVAKEGKNHRLLNLGKYREIGNYCQVICDKER